MSVGEHACSDGLDLLRGVMRVCLDGLDGEAAADGSAVHNVVGE